MKCHFSVIYSDKWKKNEKKIINHNNLLTLLNKWFSLSKTQDLTFHTLNVNKKGFLKQNKLLRSE